MENMIKSDPLHVLLHQAADCIDHMKFDEAKTYLAQALLLNDRAPQVHNLLGVIYHLQGHRDVAIRHYRAAYVFDSTYQPAIDNLILCSSSHRIHDTPIYGCDDATLEERLDKKRRDNYVQASE